MPEKSPGPPEDAGAALGATGVSTAGLVPTDMPAKSPGPPLRAVDGAPVDGRDALEGAGDTLPLGEAAPPRLMPENSDELFGILDCCWGAAALTPDPIIRDSKSSLSLVVAAAVGAG